MSQIESTSTPRESQWITLSLVLAAIVTLPLIGRWIAGNSIRSYLEFPPTTHSVSHEPFSWPIFSTLAFLIACLMVICVTFASRMTSHHSRPAIRPNAEMSYFPWWGWLAAGWTLLAWLLAWTRFEWMRPFQTMTFAPLWWGYIATVNALTFRRLGRCMMRDRPRYFFSLFPLSAAFWWLFEYLNRFVQNWHYLGGPELTAWEYFWQATLSFATVLPAVLGTAELLTTYSQHPAMTGFWGEIQIGDRVRCGWGILAIGAGGLFGLGLWPDYLFPFVWVAPLLLIVAVQLIRGEPTIFAATSHADRRTLQAMALAALICGFFWELWNFYSLAHWEYTLPFVQRFQLFHMPLLGYAGYLPFGLECWAVADLCLARRFAGGAAYYRAPVA